MAKWAFYVLVFIYMCYRAVYGAKIDNSISVDQIHYGNEGFLEVGGRKTISCKASTKNQRLEWVDPFGNIVERVSSKRIYAQEQIVSSPRGGRAPGLVLTLSELLASDSGVYQCKSGEQKKSVRVCAIKPSEFVDTPASITTETGRAITLTCQAKGDPEPRLVWLRDDEELSEGVKHPKYRVNRKYNSHGYESLLTIVSLEPEDAGLYTCVSVQESPMLDNCTHLDTKNVTLWVNYAPSFKNPDNIKLVYGSEGEMVDFKCSAKGWPKPLYKWMEDQGATLNEFDKSEIQFSEDPHSAVLSVKVGKDGYGKILKCKATNILGTAEKEFKLLEREKPEEFSDIQVHLAKSNRIHFNVTWDDEIFFPVDGFDIQYVETSKFGPSAADKYIWKKAKLVHKDIDLEEQDDEDNGSGIIVPLDGLKPTTNYFVRMRAVNEAGQSLWSDKVNASTTDEVDTEAEAEKETEEPEVAPTVAEENDPDNGMFYGIFFAGSILVVAVICMFAMRLV